MYKKYKIKNSKLVLNFLLMSCIVLTICLLSVGYAKITETYLNIGVNVFSNKYMQIFISEVKLASNNGADLVNSKIIDYTDTMLHSDIYLSTEDSTSSITYTITIFNNSDADKKFVDVTYLEELYRNSAIDYKIEGLNKGEHIDKGTGKTFNLTFFYKDTTDLSKNELDSYLSFDFDYYYGEENDIDVIIKDEGNYNFAGATPENPVNFADITNINFKVVNGTGKQMIALQIDISYKTTTGSKQSAKIDICDENDKILMSKQVDFLGKQSNGAVLSIPFEFGSSITITNGTSLRVKFSQVKGTNNRVDVDGVTLIPTYQDIVTPTE